MLRSVLLTYSVYDIPLGYVQGLNMITAVLLYHIKSPQETFWALAELMEEQELRMVFLDQFKHLRAHQQRILQVV